MRNRRHLAEFIKLLMQGAYSTQDLANKTGISYEAVREMIKEMRAIGIVRIRHRRLDSMGRASISVWELGEGPDVPKPSAKTALERNRKYLARKEQPLNKTPKKVRAVSSVFDLGNKD